MHLKQEQIRDLVIKWNQPGFGGAPAWLLSMLGLQLLPFKATQAGDVSLGLTAPTAGRSACLLLSVQNPALMNLFSTTPMGSNIVQ